MRSPSTTLDEEELLVVRPALPGQAIFCGRTPASLQKFLQRRFAIRVRDAIAAFFQACSNKTRRNTSREGPNPASR